MSVMWYLFTWLYVFTIALVTDVAYTIYVRRSAQGNPRSAARWSFVIALGNALTVVEYIQDKWLILAVALGYYVGTYLTVKLDTQ